MNIAHAGGELEGPDETIFTFRQALANGADVLEMNVQLSADGQLVLHHDATVDAKTNGTGPVVGKTAAELNALDAAYWWVPDVGVVQDRRRPTTATAACAPGRSLRRRRRRRTTSACRRSSRSSTPSPTWCSTWRSKPRPDPRSCRPWPSAIEANELRTGWWSSSFDDGADGGSSVPCCPRWPPARGCR